MAVLYFNISFNYAKKIEKFQDRSNRHDAL